MKKRIVSIILALSMIVSYFVIKPPLLVNADRSGDQGAGQKVTLDVPGGQYIAKVQSDEITQLPDMTEKFDGTTGASAGQIWTNKNVGISKDNDGNFDGFDITLSATAQEYMISGGEDSAGYGEGNADAVDVTFILDLSGSMVGNDGKDINYPGEGNIYRAEAMNMAVNDVIDSIILANSNNRIAIHWFTGTVESDHIGTLMPLDNYTTTNIQKETNNKYIRYYTSSGKHYLENATGLKKSNGRNHIFKKEITGGTPTQDGIKYGVENMIKDIENTDKSNQPSRKPFVLILSDGSAIQARKDWWYDENTDWTNAKAYNKNNKNEGDENNHLPTSGTVYPQNTGFYYIQDGNDEITAATILTGRLMKDKLEAAYKRYNGKTTSSQFYTIGLGSANEILWSNSRSS